ncbi:unnamed protein product [Diatraea saccharalis]|uniref:Uncharacterized protein n=1 Tax=Diatraea saccharalis TaxID=40085 RepID=A0A9N9R1C1_9NEOP|nr:unnamed protein product [Diatraea saccharalis]
MNFQYKGRIKKIFENLESTDTHQSSKKDVIEETNYVVNDDGSLSLEAEKPTTKTLVGNPKNIMLTEDKDMILFNPCTSDKNMLRNIEPQPCSPIFSVSSNLINLNRLSPIVTILLDDDTRDCEDTVTRPNLEPSDATTSVEGHASSSVSPSILKFNDSDDIQPTEKKRKKKPNKETWEKIKNQKLREKGEEYKGRHKDAGIWNYNISKKESNVKPRCNCKLSNKTTKLECAKLTEEERTDIFEEFWRMSWKEKKIYVRSLVVVKPKARSRANESESKRKNSLELYLKKKYKKHSGLQDHVSELTNHRGMGFKRLDKKQ